MCHLIPAEFVLATYFLRSSEPLTFRRLREIRYAIESSFEELVYVDVSTPSLASAIELYPKMFQWDGDEIVKAESSDSLFERYVQRSFPPALDDEVSRRAREAIVNLSR